MTKNNTAVETVREVPLALMELIDELLGAKVAMEGRLSLVLRYSGSNYSALLHSAPGGIFQIWRWIPRKLLYAHHTHPKQISQRLAVIARSPRRRTSRSIIYQLPPAPSDLLNSPNDQFRIGSVSPPSGRRIRAWKASAS
uniref:Uncharacterized protein n=1 Tax=Peronospora matthiolae TaxID=2874970 RepID=A0AAV1TY63_9STRA